MATRSRVSLLGLQLSRTESAALSRQIARDQGVTRRTAQRYLSGEIRAPPSVVRTVHGHLNAPGRQYSAKLPPQKPAGPTDTPPPCPPGQSAQWVDETYKASEERTTYADRADAEAAALELTQDAQLSRVVESQDQSADITSVRVEFVAPGRVVKFAGPRGKRGQPRQPQEYGQVPSSGVWRVITRRRGGTGRWICSEGD